MAGKRKAFFGRVPFPVMHIDTEKKFPEMCAFRDRYVKGWDLNLIAEQLSAGRRHRSNPAARTPDPPRARRLGLREHHRQIRLPPASSPASAATRKAVRAMERVFSPRG